MPIDYSHVTEVPGDRASAEQIHRLSNRYHFAKQYCKGKDILEVACGAGQGLGYLSKIAMRIAGGDYTYSLVKKAQQYYQGRIPLMCFDAHQLPFKDRSFDVVILYEAIYYLIKPEKFVDEAHRVLREDGILIICTVNKDWADFNPSPYSTQYFSIPELTMLLSLKFPIVKLYGAFSTRADSFKDKIISVIKKIAIALHLIPKTMKGKERLKRIFFGKLIPMPSEILDGMAEKRQL